MGSQFGGKADERTLLMRTVMRRSSKSCLAAIVVVVSRNMLEADWSVEQRSWKS